MLTVTSLGLSMDLLPEVVLQESEDPPEWWPLGDVGASESVMSVKICKECTQEIKVGYN